MPTTTHHLLGQFVLVAALVLLPVGVDHTTFPQLFTFVSWSTAIVDLLGVATVQVLLFSANALLFPLNCNIMLTSFNTMALVYGVVKLTQFPSFSMHGQVSSSCFLPTLGC